MDDFSPSTRNIVKGFYRCKKLSTRVDLTAMVTEFHIHVIVLTLMFNRQKLIINGLDFA